MLAGIIGDVIGSVYEAYQWNNKSLPLIQELPLKDTHIKPLLKDVKWVRQEYSWTDDTLCTLALYHAYINNQSPKESLLYFCNKYKSESIGFGKAFTNWLEKPIPYKSFGNGSIMRIGFIPYLNLTLDEKLELGQKYTAISHNHPDSFLAVSEFIKLSDALKKDKLNEDYIKSSLISVLSAYHYNKTVKDLHHEFKFEMNALQTLLQACVIVLESNSMEDILRHSFYVGGDSDTLACVACNLGSMLYETPKDLLKLSLNTLKPYPDLYSLITHFIKSDYK